MSLHQTRVYPSDLLRLSGPDLDRTDVATSCHRISMTGVMSYGSIIMYVWKKEYLQEELNEENIRPAVPRRQVKLSLSWIAYG